MKKLFAFTLAEVLVTLGIIGVVSALTLPVLMAAYQKNVTLTQLKKSYSSLSQAVRLSEADNGFLSDWDVGYGHNLFENYILPYLNIVDYCILGECENKGIHFGLEGNKYVVPAGPNGTDKLPGDKDNTWIVVMSDGSMLYVYQSLYNNYVISRIILDLNGNKRPNRTGKDIFSLASPVWFVHDIVTFPISTTTFTGYFFSFSFNRFIGWKSRYCRYRNC